jgi:GNAT superfamily N-acetyltransferase
LIIHTKEMNDLPESLFANPVWSALQTKHRHFAISAGEACRYPADVTPFAAVATPAVSALQSLHSLLAPDEYVWLVGEKYPAIPELSCLGNLDCLQMALPKDVAPPTPMPGIIPLSNANAAEMVALTDLAFPGFFRSRTSEMGSYYGVRSIDGELIAMGGERLKLDGYPEISGICTHPAHRGNGFAAGLIWHIAQNHRREGLFPWLHVAAENHGAIELYLKLGFSVVRTVKLHRISRND